MLVFDLDFPGVATSQEVHDKNFARIGESLRWIILTRHELPMMDPWDEDVQFAY